MRNPRRNVAMWARDGRSTPIGKIAVSWMAKELGPGVPGLMAKLRAAADAIGRYNMPSVPLRNWVSNLGISTRDDLTS